MLGKGRGHAWQKGEGMRGKGGLYMVKGACMAEGHPWQDRQPLQRTVRILLECILVSYLIDIEACNSNVMIFSFFGHNF